MIRHVTSAVSSAATSAVTSAVWIAAVTWIAALGNAQQPQQLSSAAAAQTLRADRLEAKADSAANSAERDGRERAMRLHVDASFLFDSAGSLPRAAKALIAAAVIAGDLTTLDSAVKLQRNALKLATAAGDDTTRAWALSEIGISFYVAQMPDSALNYLAQSLAVRQRLRLVGPEGETLANFGAVFLQYNHPDSAARYLTLALPLLEQAKERDTYEQTLYNVGRLALQVGRPDSAIRTQRRVIPIADSVKDFHTVAQSHVQIGTAFEMRWRQTNSRADVDSALANYMAAHAIIGRLGEPATEAIILNDLGLTERRLGNPRAALSYYDSALAIHRRLHDRRSEGEVLQNIGITLGANGDPTAALDTLFAALAVHRERGDTAWEWLAFKEIGNVFQREIVPRKLDRAAAYYDSAATLLATLTASVGANADQLTFEEQQYNRDLFDEWTLASLSQAPRIGGERAAREALEATERGRAQTLLALLRTATSDSRTRQSRPGPPRAGPRARDGSHALSYLVTRDTLVVWLLGDRGDVRAVRRAISRDSLGRLVAALRIAMGVEQSASVLRVDPVAAEQLLNKLGEILLPKTLMAAIPARSGVVIIPDGPLTLIPFAALPAGPDEPAGVRYAISYAPSLAALAALDSESVGTEAASSLRSLEALVAGDPRMPLAPGGLDGDVALDSLPRAASEARHIARELHASALIGPQATEVEVLKRLPSAAVVHLATHGVAFNTESQVRNSFIALASGGGKSGILTIGEILDSLPMLRADLVVLSACQTALGDITHAEGTVGFQRAFLAKGAHSVLVSLWSVSDEATELLMESFYDHWIHDADHPGKAEALRRAQANVRRRHAFSAPKFWAGFQLVGSG